jgi:tryptophan synthase beta subunit
LPRSIRTKPAASNAIGYASQYSRSHDAVIRVYDEAGNVIETHEHAGDFREAS